jgi:hypothetical protein
VGYRVGGWGLGGLGSAVRRFRLRASGCRGFGVRGSDLEHGIDSGFRVNGVGFRVKGLGFGLCLRASRRLQGPKAEVQVG